MQKLILLLIVLTLSPTAALAHHKPGHQLPPGQMSKFQDPVEVPVPVKVIQLAVGTSAISDELVWRRYVDEEYAFEIDLPLGLFEFGEEADRGLFLRAVDGQGEMKVYGANNSLAGPPASLHPYWKSLIGSKRSRTGPEGGAGSCCPATTLTMMALMNP